nr:MAG TPA: hypothetical protein [Caudoviricetes sp.]
MMYTTRYCGVYDLELISTLLHLVFCGMRTTYIIVLAFCTPHTLHARSNSSLQFPSPDF